jgi:hypothetical protein
MADKKPNQNITGSFLEYPIRDLQTKKDIKAQPRLNSPNISFSMPSPVIPSAIPPQSMPSDNVIRSAGLQTMPQEPVSSEDDTNFLGSLIAQGVAGIGTGLMGGFPRDILNSANMFQYMRDQQTKRNKSDLLMDPKSEESKKRRLVFKNLGYDVPEDLSYTDLGNSDVLRSLRSKQMEQPKLAGTTRQGGVSGKTEKEVKSDNKLLGDYSKHAESLQSSIDVIEAVNKLNRSRLGKYTPDFYTDTQAEAGTVDRAGAGLVKVLAGAGTVSDSDFDRLKGLVPNSNMTKELAKETAKRQTLEGTQKSLAGLRIDKDLGRINETDFRKIINQYNKYLKNPKLELNKFIDDNGELVDSTSPSTIEFSEEK